MLESIENAYNVNGPKKVSIAYNVKVSVPHLYCWLNGKTPIPKQRRQSFDRALGDGAAVDWQAYEKEMAALKSPEQPAEQSVQPRKPEPAPRTTLRPETPVSGPEIAPQPKKSFWANLIIDDTDEAEHAV